MKFNPDNYKLGHKDDVTEDNGPLPEELLLDSEPTIAAELPLGSDPRNRPIRRPRNPGMTGTIADYAKARVVIEESVRRRFPDWTEDAIQAQADHEYEQMCNLGHEKFVQLYVRTEPTSVSPPREDIRENIEAKATRRVPEVQELESLLAVCKDGRPTDRKLTIGVFMRAALCSGKPELRRILQGFEGSDAELDWAFLDTPDPNEVRTMLRHERTVAKVLKGALRRNNPDCTIDLNLRMFERLAQHHPDAGRWLVADATEIQADVPQCSAHNEHHAHLMRGGTGATEFRHGGGVGQKSRKVKYWVGYKLLVIGDLATGLPLIWRLIDNRGEFAHITPMLEDLLERAPYLNPECLIGDSEYDRKARLALDLEQRFGIHPVFPLRDNIGQSYEWVNDLGVPRCSQHGLMKRVQADDFTPMDPDAPYEEDEGAARKAFKARIRWKCDTEGCGAKATTRPRDNPRLYTYFPHRGNHKLVAMRRVLLARRNIIEAVFSQLKRRGIGGITHHKPSWVSKKHEMEWLCFTALFGMTARRLAHETGLYEQAANDAWDLGLVKVRSSTSVATMAAVAA